MVRAAVAESANETGERILAAGLEAFAEKGFDGASTRDIAARAGVNLGLLQYHFGGKLALWRAAVDRAFADMREGLDAVLADTADADDRERLRRMIRAHVAFVAERTEFVRIMHDEGKRRGPRMRWLVDRHVKPLYAALVPMIERAQASGVLPAAIPAVHLVYVLIGAVDVIFHQAEECKRVAGIDPHEPEAVEAHATAVELLFLAASKPENAR